METNSLAVDGRWKEGYYIGTTIPMYSEGEGNQTRRKLWKLEADSRKGNSTRIPS